MTFGSLQKVTTILQGWRFTTTGNPVTPQLTNPLGAKCFYNKVPVLKMRLTPSKSYKTEQPAYANWAKMPSQRAPVCPCPHSKDWFHSNGKCEGAFYPRPPCWVPFLTCTPVGISCLCTPPPTPVPNILSTLTTRMNLHGLILHQIIFYWELIYWKICI